MPILETKKHIAILGGGPSGMFAYKRFVESGEKDLVITIFEKSDRLGAGMPYSLKGASDEHITNVSDNEIPEIVTSIQDWVKTAPKELLNRFNICPDNFNEYKVLPRLFFGEYLTAQFDLLKVMAEKAGIETNILMGNPVEDVIDLPLENKVRIVSNNKTADFDVVIISTGHNWPVKHEGKVSGYFESPYPPAKLDLKANCPIAIKGSSLTAVDAVRTLAHNNGNFVRENGKLRYIVDKESTGFKMVMHSRSGLLPAVRFHLADTHLQNDSLLSTEQIEEHIVNNNGFLSLDYIFEKDFKEPIKEKDAKFYKKIKDLRVEEFVNKMLDMRKGQEAFELLRAEYDEAAESIKKRKSIYWKEMLGVLSFAMNYPAKHLSAEDMQRLQKVLLPLISIVIAYMPQSSSEQFLALHDAGVLDIVAVGEDSRVRPRKKGGAVYQFKDAAGNKHADAYKLFVNCVGQPHLPYKKFPFKSLRKDRTVVPARLKFRDKKLGKAAMKADDRCVVKNKAGDYFLKVSGIAINDNFQVVNATGGGNPRVYLMAVPYMAGYNPDYSGLDFCEEASKRLVNTILNI
ncbi:FAD/NAD(P)-binding protein [Mucilaginibacter ginkgonis]|uniref:FAD/NAD(P)-binding protein n=1 Tax=Mucilaginibacter ginkgonis TaxID=2682091 RepID=A0A6I4HYK1_9SPHI|nr:FAD/NAD(P)-binding protein [Mucilaginibacter ginkgonis]QQL50313.1 FAD/NAD(P)-binding protein [Mucilaginibacter ginkgonis]